MTSNNNVPSYDVAVNNKSKQKEQQEQQLMQQQRQQLMQQQRQQLMQQQQRQHSPVAVVPWTAPHTPPPPYQPSTPYSPPYPTMTASAPPQQQGARGVPQAMPQAMPQVVQHGVHGGGAHVVVPPASQAWHQQQAAMLASPSYRSHDICTSGSGTYTPPAAAPGFFGAPHIPAPTPSYYPSPNVSTGGCCVQFQRMSLCQKIVLMFVTCFFMFVLVGSVIGVCAAISSHTEFEEEWEKRNGWFS